MFKKAILIILTALALGLAGCQLADANTYEEESLDALCGMFITFDSPSFQQYDTETDEAIVNAILNGGSYDIQKDRCYAQKVTGEDDDVDYVFNGFNGYRLFALHDEKKGCYVMYGDKEYFDWNLVSSGQGVTLDGRMHAFLNTELRSEDGAYVLRSNPVYQTCDGRLYFVHGDGFYLSSPDGSGMGSLGRLSNNSTYDITSGGSSKTLSSLISIEITGIHNVNRYVLKQMDSGDNVISAAEITEAEIPYSLAVEQNSAYAVLEAYGEDKNGSVVIDYTMIEVDADSFTVYFPDGNGVARVYHIALGY